MFMIDYTEAVINHIIPGAYHTARPDESPGDVQADVFETSVRGKGAGQIGDGKMLPGAVNLGGTLSTRVGEVPLSSHFLTPCFPR